MTLDKRKALLATVLYADIFGWPLTREEIVEWGIGRIITKGALQFSHAIDSLLTPQETYFFLKGRRFLVSKRRKSEAWARQKWTIAARVADVLRHIPTLMLIGVTGGLSRSNVQEEDDIDLFCITLPATLWISRLLAVVVVDILGRRRHPQDRQVKNKICLNMFMSEDALSISGRERDLFAAHEVLQMRPMREQNGTYSKFIHANAWAKNFLPNAWENKVKSEKLKVKRYLRKNFTFYILHFIFRLFEPLARTLQLWYMRRRRTSEVISPGVLRFHPRDAREWVSSAFAKRLSRFNLPLDKIFYGS